jgi:hypothetical protein
VFSRFNPFVSEGSSEKKPLAKIDAPDLEKLA